MPNNVLILGAGASRHYDFPLAFGIVQRIRSGTDSMQQHLATFDIEDAAYVRVVTRLLASGCTSVDQFAEYLDDPADILVAKALIAYHLGVFEVHPALHAERTGNHWYELLANHLIGPKLDTFPQRDVAIITFNYERSLEQYLFDCLTSRFERQHSEADIHAALLRLPIVHIYGRMGPLPGFAKPGEKERKYEPVRGPLEMNAAITGMHILRELRADPGRGERDAARQHLRDAKGAVTFLGFAYARENLEALDLVNTGANKTGIYGTIVGFGDDERYKELVTLLRRFNVSLNEPWRFDVYNAILTRPLTILGPPQ